MRIRNRIVSAGLVALLAAGPCSVIAAPAGVALADPASDLEAAAAQLDSLGAELASFQDQLASATTALEQTDVQVAEKQAQIESTSQELADRRAQLGENMSSTYKAGSEGLLGFILGSTSADELVSRIYYLDKVSEQEAANIEGVRQLEEQLNQEMSELEQTQATQQQQVSDLQSQVDAYQGRVAEATAYYNSLDAQVQAELAAQQESENVANAIQTVENSQAQQEAAEGGTTTQAPPAETEPDTGGQADEQPPAQQEPPAADADTSRPSGGSGSSAPAGGGLSTAYAQIGKPYVYGASGPNAFDCSGLVCYCYGNARGRTTYAMIQSLQASGDWKTSMDQLAVGDLVFPHSGHVGIYVGDGMMIHAANPSVGVVLAPVYSFYGGGSYY